MVTYIAPMKDSTNVFHTKWLDKVKDLSKNQPSI
jgi:hypothetical protein